MVVAAGKGDEAKALFSYLKALYSSRKDTIVESAEAAVDLLRTFAESEAVKANNKGKQKAG